MESPASPSCPRCTSERIRWQVHRTGTRWMQHSPRELRWVCRDCAHEWSDALLDPEGDLPPMTPLGG